MGHRAWSMEHGAEGGEREEMPEITNALNALK